MTMNASIHVYTMKNCPYCLKAKQLLTQRGIPFTETLVSHDNDAQWESLFQKSGMKTLPQIFHGDQLIGGYQELSELDKKDNLQSLR